MVVLSRAMVLFFSALASTLLGFAAADYQCGSDGTVHYTYRYGDAGGSETYFAICPTNSFVNNVDLSTDSSQRLTQIDFTCSDPVSTDLTLATQNNAADEYDYDSDGDLGGASLAPGPTVEPQDVEGSTPSGVYFNSATGYTGANNSDIISQITFTASNAESFSAGSSLGYSTTTTLPFSFGLPSNARVIGFNSTFAEYVNSLALIYCA